MLEYYRIDISEGIGVNKYEPHLFKYEPYLCNGFHDLMQKAFSFNDVANAYIKRSAYRIRFIIINRAKYYYENDKKKIKRASKR